MEAFSLCYTSNNINCEKRVSSLFIEKTPQNLRYFISFFGCSANSAYLCRIICDDIRRIM